MMKTERLYYTQPETTEFCALVLECTRADDAWEATLDRTAFYPEGGGQPSDLGTIDGVGVAYVFERGDKVVHRLTAPLTPGTEVTGRIDARRRRDHSEQHTADHVLTGVIRRKYGFENVGFHMGADTTTIDLSGVLSAEQLAEMENEANAVIRANLPIIESYPSKAELEILDYRSKKELDGEVRIITIPGVDVCACCGTHLRSTGELGLIKVLSAVHLRGGIRLELVAGERAWRHIAAVFEENRKNSVLLSAKQLETSAAVERILEEKAQQKALLQSAQSRYFAAVSAAHAGSSRALLFEEVLDTPQLQKLADALMTETDGLCAVFSGSDAEGWRYAIGQRGGDLRELVKRVNESLGGKGGGKPGFAQGRVSACRAEIQAFFENME